MRGFIRNYTKRLGVTYETDNLGNIYITKGLAENDTYPCIVAHLDQVQDCHSEDFMAVETSGVIYGFSARKMQLEGLGADDKNGIWIALKALERFDSIKVAFFVKEEVGCVGSSNCDMSFFDDVRFVIEPDRRGSNDLITSISGLQMCSDEFVEAINPSRWGYRPTNGMMTDILSLRQNGLEVSCINLSCGYYKPHTDEEMTRIEDIENCKDFVFSIIDSLEKREYFAPKVFRDYYGYGYGGCGNGFYDGCCGGDIPYAKELENLCEDDIYTAVEIIAQNMRWEHPDDIWMDVKPYFESRGILRYEFAKILEDAYYYLYEDYPWWSESGYEKETYLFPKESR